MSAVTQTVVALQRRPLRTFLTALGTALGIATIVALLAVADGAKRSAGEFFHLGASDLGLFQADAADPTTSVLPLSLGHTLLATPGITGISPILLMIEDIPSQLGAVVYGVEPHTFLTDRMVFLSGHMFAGRNQVAVGNLLAQTMHLRVGSALVIAHHRFTVSGIFHIGVSIQDTGAFIPLATAQAITDKPGETTTFAVRLGIGTRPQVERARLKRRFPGLIVIADGEEAPRAGANAALLAKAATVIAVLAIIIGGIGVMNTMLMSVIERRSEFALLSAVGWSGRQIAIRVLIEGVLTTILGTALGLLLGVIGAGLLVHVLGAGEFVTPDVTAWDLGDALLVGVLLGVLGGLYPAWRAARVSPAQVLAAR
ncbi:ABC transporter permease [Conexibacter sp. DBS9H8]|uniref:ABC transporter permease n=1 Tax=Conexibacter sp. DBS9H8 TaxID=2937801 RepID=UPI0020103FDA|nr:ABC transporter permease [Conexibacter sp. DBS9H8]